MPDASQFRHVDTATDAKEIRSIVMRRVGDSDPDLSYLGSYSNKAGPYFNPAWQNYADGKGNLADEKEDMRYMRQDFERMESYHRGEWGMVGVYARASITVAGIIQTVQSGGLWGIESDSDESYFAEIEAEQLSELVTVLEELGFERTAIDEACEDVTDASD